MGKLEISYREIQFDDWEKIHEYASQNEACLYQPWGPNSKEDTKEYVKNIVEDSKKFPRTRYVFAVTLGDDEIIGAGEVNIRDIKNRRGEISYIIHPQYWGNGYATDAASFLLQFGFSKLNLHRMYATCDPRNIASSRVLEKIGMKFEGRMRDTLYIRDGWRDSLLYSILEDE